MTFKLFIYDHYFHSSATFCCFLYYELLVTHTHTHTRLHITDTYAGPPWLFLDPTAQPLLEGESINLTCYITGATSSQRELLIITWLKDGTTIDKPDTVEVVRGQVLRLRGGGSDQSGVYTCEVAGERAEGANITVSG